MLAPAGRLGQSLRMSMLDELSTKPHDERVRAMIALGREPRARESIQALSRGDVYSRRLALASCWSSRDGAHVVRALTDASRRVRGLALRLVPVACDDAQALEALQIAFGIRADKVLVRNLVRRGRHGVVDRFLDWLRARNARRELAELLPFGTEECVRRHLDYALEQPSASLFHRLAANHPVVLGEVLCARWRAAAEEADPVTRQLTSTHHRAIAERAPAAAMALARVLVERRIEPVPEVWRALVAFDASGCLELAREHGVRLPDGIVRTDRVAPSIIAEALRIDARLVRARRRDLEEWSAEERAEAAAAWAGVAERWPRQGDVWLAHLSDGPERERAFELFRAAVQDEDGIVAPHMLVALPPELRAREARRHLHGVVALEPHPERRVTGYARYLPWDEARAALESLLAHPEGATRAVALTELLTGVGVHRASERMGEALELVLARKHEQDPVRCAMWAALDGWPRGLWTAAHLPAVGQMIRDGLDAADLSDATAAQAERLVIALFAVDGTWASTWLATLIRERGRLYDPKRFELLRDEDVVAAAPALLEVARSWAARERYGWLSALAESLGARIRSVEGLSAVIAAARDRAPHEWDALSLTAVLMEHDRPLFDATIAASVQRFLERRWFYVIAKLAERNEGAAVPALSDGLCAVARRLPSAAELDAALRVLRKRDPAAFARLVPELIREDMSLVIFDVVWRFLHRHRSDLLDPFLEPRPMRGRFATGKTAWLFPATDGFFRWTPSQVQLFAESLERVVRDPERDTPTLLWALSIWPELEYAPMDGLCALASDRRPAVREKTIRVLARCDAGQGVPTLLECLGDSRARFAIYGLRRAALAMPPRRALEILKSAPMGKVTVAKEVVRLTGEVRSDEAYQHLVELDRSALHRDVRVALLRALWDHLEREPTWEVLERAVEGEDWVLAAKVGDVPADRLTHAVDRRLSALLARVLDRPEPEARLDLLQRARWLSIRDPEGSFLAACRARLRSRYDDEVTAAMNALMARQREADVPALEGALAGLRDDPRSLSVSVGALLAHDVRSRRSWSLAAAALERALEHPEWQPLRVRAALAHREDGELGSFIARLADEGALGHDVVEELRSGMRPLEGRSLAPVVARLAEHESVAARLLALRALELDVEKRGWSEKRLGQLAKLRTDPSPEVAGAAKRVFPPREKDVSLV